MSQKPQSNEGLLADESFQRWLSGEADDEERNRWSHWLDAEPSNREMYAEARMLLSCAQFRSVSPPDIEAELEKLRVRLHLKEAISVRKAAPPEAAPIRPWRFGRASWVRFGAIAAAAMVFVAVAVRFVSVDGPSGRDAFQVASTDYGKRVQIALPEGTKIILNAHSSLKYPSAWAEGTPRRFELQGEAYFDVAPQPRGARQPFVVITKDGLVRVVGTRFVVYERGQGTRVAVEEGNVEAIVADTSDLITSPVAKVLLEPGNLLEFQKGTRDLVSRKVDIRPYVSWWRDQLILHDTLFHDIVLRLEETFGVAVEVRDEGLLRRTLSGSVENRGLDVVIQALAKALRVSVHREGKLVVFGG